MSRQDARTQRTTDRAWRLGVLAALVSFSCLAGCAAVKPQQRAALADPAMQFQSEPQAEAARYHAIENREGSSGGNGAAGGGCGCN